VDRHAPPGAARGELRAGEHLDDMHRRPAVDARQHLEGVVVDDQDRGRGHLRLRRCGGAKLIAPPRTA
jgi:hypothetical protein